MITVKVRLYKNNILISFKLFELLIKFYDSHTILFLKGLLLFFSSLKRRLLFSVTVRRLRLKRRLFICWNDWNAWKSIFCKPNSSSFDPKKGLLVNYCKLKAPFVWILSYEFETTSFRNKRRLLFGVTPITLPNIPTNQFYQRRLYYHSRTFFYEL